MEPRTAVEGDRQQGPVVLAWNHDGVATSGYRLFVDGVMTDLGRVTPTTSGRYQITYAGFALGDHVVIVAAAFSRPTSRRVSRTPAGS